ncbi:hypothetical protein ACINB_16480 [Acidovorax sp. NB1]|nr:hypothetical protein ACINB_16480 [Acidovorax sp. NB1]
MTPVGWGRGVQPGTGAPMGWAKSFVKEDMGCRALGGKNEEVEFPTLGLWWTVKKIHQCTI